MCVIVESCVCTHCVTNGCCSFFMTDATWLLYYKCIQKKTVSVKINVSKQAQMAAEDNPLISVWSQNSQQQVFAKNGQIEHS